MKIILLIVLFLPTRANSQNFLSLLSSVITVENDEVLFCDELYPIGRNNTIDIIQDSLLHSLRFTSSNRRFGFIGDDFKRLWIHFTDISPSPINSTTFKVSGKSKTGSNICNFKGTIKVIESHILDETNNSEYTFGVMLSSYNLLEDTTQSFTGKFSGLIVSFWKIDTKTNELTLYNSTSDFYFNNWFSGTWESYKNGRVKKANWGSERIPDSKKLDFGTGEFGPSPTFDKNGWKTFRIYSGAKKSTPEQYEWAKNIEIEQWWLK